MTDAPKIDTQAPDTSREYIQRMIACAPFADQTAGIPEMVATLRAILAERDLADARAAAAWIAGRDALADAVLDTPISDLAVDEVLYAAKQLTPPTDTTALDRLIAERVREAVEAEREACAKVAEAETGWKGQPHVSQMEYGPGIGSRIAAKLRAPTTGDTP